MLPKNKDFLRVVILRLNEYGIPRLFWNLLCISSYFTFKAA